MADFVAAYNRSRFWHGTRGGNISALTQTGLLVNLSNCLPDSPDPTSGNGGGIICLGTTVTSTRSWINSDVSLICCERTRLARRRSSIATK